MNKTALILAGGSGTRAGGGIPKQFRDLCGRPVIWYSMHAFMQADPATRLLLVVHEDWTERLRNILEEMPAELRYPFETVTGGGSRIHSVMKGLAAISQNDGYGLVAVHDAARPLVSAAMIRRGWKTAAAHNSAVPVVPLADSIREITPTGSIATDRAAFRLVQTPQIFNVRLLKSAYGKIDPEDVPVRLTDDASVLEEAGQPVTLYDGIPENIKITTPIDFTIAEGLLRHSHNG